MAGSSRLQAPELMLSAEPVFLGGTVSAVSPRPIHIRSLSDLFLRNVDLIRMTL